MLNSKGAIPYHIAERMTFEELMEANEAISLQQEAINKELQKNRKRVKGKKKG